MDLFPLIKGNAQTSFKSLHDHIKAVQGKQDINNEMNKTVFDYFKQKKIHQDRLTKDYLPTSNHILRDIMTANYIIKMGCDSPLLIYYLHYTQYFAKLLFVFQIHVECITTH